MAAGRARPMSQHAAGTKVDAVGCPLPIEAVKPAAAAPTPTLHPTGQVSARAAGESGGRERLPHPVHTRGGAVARARRGRRGPP